MKLNNPFNRKNKTDFIPLSLFPASKMTRTSMQIGRFVPLYAIEMRKNNHIKLSHDQLTRFASMRAPVMQNFEIEFGAYFCPYVALDKFFDSSWFRENIINGNNGDFTKWMLRARDFFNPATADSLRRHPIKLSRHGYGSDFIGVGSLFDHLQMPLYFKELSDGFRASFAAEGITKERLTFDQMLVETGNVGISDLVNTDSLQYLYKPGFYAGDIAFFAMFVYVQIYRNILGLDMSSSLYLDSLQEMAAELLSVDSQDIETSVLSPIVSYILNIGTPELISQGASYYNEYLGGIRPADLVEDYKSYVQNRIAGIQYGARKGSNLTAWLVYLCIYGHYCLNELFVSHEDWDDFIGCAYLTLAQAMDVDPTESDLQMAFTQGNLNQYNNPKLLSSPYLDFFAKYLRRCECLPILWNKDQFTGAQRIETTSDTPIGNTIVENFFNRMYARFKDLIARMGGDYNKNVDALLGGKIPDSTLNYPQVVKKTDFTVQIGDIAQTSASQVDSFLGEFAGYAVSRDSSESYEWTAEEDGMFMVCAWARPKNVAVANAIPRHNLKDNFFDYLIPQFGGVGYQDIPYAQIFPEDDNPDQKFAIQEKYFEYMTVLNECSGLMRTRLKHYHCDRLLENAPDPLTDETTRGLDFLYVTEKDNINRIFNDQISDPIIMAALFKGTITRQLPAKIQTEF